MLCQIFFETLS
uniref:Uncharacterized protein n=1 Tax=Arundo donax TaxID=35708 RepID=A0A0A9HJM4_ARUDO